MKPPVEATATPLVAPRMRRPTAVLRLIVRGDDAGSSEAANRAIVGACRAGVLRNVSVMACGPAFEDAAVRLRALRRGGLFLSIGLHVTLNSEWKTWRWGPVSPPQRVPTLVDHDGCFFPSPQHLHDRGFSPEEAEAEVTAQLRRMRQHGLEPDYLDEHMGVGWLDGLAAVLRRIAVREGLVLAERFPSLPTRDAEPPPTTVAELTAALRAQLDRVSHRRQPVVWITHPDSPPEHPRWPGPRLAGEQRDLERRSLIDPALRSLLDSWGVEPISYTSAMLLRSD